VLLLRRLREHRPDTRHPTSRLTAITYQWPPVGRVLPAQRTNMPTSRPRATRAASSPRTPRWRPDRVESGTDVGSRERQLPVGGLGPCQHEYRLSSRSAPRSMSCLPPTRTWARCWSRSHADLHVKTTAGPVVLERPKPRGTTEPLPRACRARRHAPMRWSRWCWRGSWVA
jgi:hypothetical protein